MSLMTIAKNEMLDALDVATASLHTGYPGTTGASEVTGGTYARVATTFNIAGAGARSLSGQIDFNVPAGTTVYWACLWDTDGVTVKAIAPNAGSPKEFIASVSADTITCLSHGYADTQTIVFYGGTAPAGLTVGTVYYVRDATTDTFKVAATSGGAAIDLTAAGDSACVVSKITPEAYAADGTHSVTSWTISLTH